MLKEMLLSGAVSLFSFIGENNGKSPQKREEGKFFAGDKIVGSISYSA